jgi:hypothetical protein
MYSNNGNWINFGLFVSFFMIVGVYNDCGCAYRVKK